MTAVEFLEKICNDRGYHLMEEYFEQAKEMEKQQIIDAFEAEISDEEIEKEMLSRSGMWDDPLCFEIGWKDAIKWYREQLKQRQ